MRRSLGSLSGALSRRRYVCASCTRHIATAAQDVASSSRSKHGLELLTGVEPSVLESREYGDLLSLFDEPSHLSSPDVTWKAYSALVRANSNYGNRIPAEIHQRALRRTLPLYAQSLDEAMSQKAKDTRERPSLSGWVPYQIRIDLILQHIRDAGTFPHIDDCHLILLHYAVWGNVRGSLDLLETIVKADRTPMARTYELVLYSFARKLALIPQWHNARARVLELLQPEFYLLLESMKSRGVRETQLIRDHCTRIVGALSPQKDFSNAVSSVYGIDVNQPDVIPQAFVDEYFRLAERERSTSDSKEPRETYTLPVVSTATLNTLVRVLGSGPNRSLTAMIGAFESLTSPLPPLRSNNEAYGYEDGLDDDEPYYAPIAHTLRRSQPVRPNTQTYAYLINNCAEMRNKVLAMHYLDEAIKTERAQQHAIRSRIREIICDPVDGRVRITPEAMVRIRNEVPRGTVGVNVYMFKAIYRYADEWGDADLIAWLSQRQQKVVEYKERSLLLLSTVEEAMNYVLGGHEVSDNVSDPALFDRHAQARIHRQSIAAITNHIDVAEEQFERLDEHSSKTAAAVKRLNERRVRREVMVRMIKTLKIDTKNKDHSSHSLYAEIRENSRVEWMKALIRKRLRMYNVSRDEITPSELLVTDVPALHAALEELEASEPFAQEHLLRDHLPTASDHQALDELRALVVSDEPTSTPPSLSIFDTPLSNDDQLPQYMEPSGSSSSSIVAGDGGTTGGEGTIPESQDRQPLTRASKIEEPLQSDTRDLPPHVTLAPA